MDSALGVKRWSLPKREICSCRQVVAPVLIKSCPMEETHADDEMVYFDSPSIRKHYWEIDELGEYLEHTKHCGNYIL